MRASITIAVLVLASFGVGCGKSAADQLAEQKIAAIHSICEADTDQAIAAARASNKHVDGSPDLTENDFTNARAFKLKDCIARRLAQ